MVENFTKTESLTYEGIAGDNKIETEEQFEEKLKATIKKFTKAPSDQIIEKILSYSKSLK
ncbi:hypothetical protein FAZ19_17530 [Sphingobacterium alkalisoli]|uniref:Uncharacterized protein n=2 Tax=Sphingobacterium alkalisoli TaxID=1874115 RepID=A0A4U0GWH1_9SPHI|nr:hypothetical protein [Sphingobacterium alkalisoli]TJY63388.1 hypothetical protein FAZ19_17530 [Sphingobacterium alkalisoli]